MPTGRARNEHRGPQKPEEAGRTLPGSPRRARGPGTAGCPACGTLSSLAQDTDTAPVLSPPRHTHRPCLQVSAHVLKPVIPSSERPYSNPTALWPRLQVPALGVESRGFACPPPPGLGPRPSVPTASGAGLLKWGVGSCVPHSQWETGTGPCWPAHSAALQMGNRESIPVQP